VADRHERYVSQGLIFPALFRLHLKQVKRMMRALESLHDPRGKCIHDGVMLRSTNMTQQLHFVWKLPFSGVADILQLSCDLQVILNPPSMYF
jgi:hypothetical protein